MKLLRSDHLQAVTLTNKTEQKLLTHYFFYSFIKHLSPKAQMVEHGASNAKIMGSIPRESKS